MTESTTAIHERDPNLERDMGTFCVFCKGRSFRRSRLKVSDLPVLLAFRYPVRCLSCSKRQTVTLPVATRAVPSSVMQVRAAHDGTPWSKTPPPTRIEPSAVASGGDIRPSSLTLQAPMPDLHGVKLAHTAYVPPGDGENLVR